MAYFAQLNDENIVTQVISVCDEDCFNENQSVCEIKGAEFCSNTWGGRWIQTWVDETKRKNFAGVGMRYDEQKDAFIGFSSFESWIFDEETCKWNPPIPMPEPVDGFIWVWNESTVSWQSIKGLEI